jgi:uncharacterized protein
MVRLLSRNGGDTSAPPPAQNPMSNCSSGRASEELERFWGRAVRPPDASFQGASGGEPRFIEDPTQRVEDFRHVADYLMTLPYVDEDRIGVLGICGGGGYSINASMTERRIQAVGTVTGVNFGRLMREGLCGFNPIGALETMAKQRTVEARGVDLHVADLIPPSPEEAKRRGMTERDVYEATEYYSTPRRQKPHGVPRSLLSHQAAAVGWDAFHLAEVLLTQPLMVVVGNKVGAFGGYRDGCEIHGRARSEKKELVVVEGASNYDLYDKPEPVAQALAKLILFYEEHLGQAQSAASADRSKTIAAE